MGSHKETEIKYLDKTNELLSDMPDYVKAYIRSIHQRVSPRTEYEYVKDIMYFFDWVKASGFTDALPSLSVMNSFKKTDFEDYLLYLEHYEKNGVERTNGRTSIKRKLSALNSFFSFLYINEYIDKNEVSKINPPKTNKKEIIYMEHDETGHLIHTVNTGMGLSLRQQKLHNKVQVRDSAIVTLLLSTGMRCSELCELDLDDIDEDNFCIHIVRKGGSEALLYYSDDAADYLHQYLIKRKALEVNTKALFLSNRNDRISPSTVRYLVKKYAKAAVPLKHITPHKLRATYATNLYEATDDIYLVANALDHKSVNTTAKYYANMSNKKKSDSRNKVKY